MVPPPLMSADVDRPAGDDAVEWCRHSLESHERLITLQATIIAYIDDFKLMMILSIAAAGLLVFLRSPKQTTAPDHSIAIE